MKAIDWATTIDSLWRECADCEDDWKTMNYCSISQFLPRLLLPQRPTHNPLVFPSSSSSSASTTSSSSSPSAYFTALRTPPRPSAANPGGSTNSDEQPTNNGLVNSRQIRCEKKSKNIFLNLQNLIDCKKEPNWSPKRRFPSRCATPTSNLQLHSGQGAFFCNVGNAQKNIKVIAARCLEKSQNLLVLGRSGAKPSVDKKEEKTLPSWWAKI